MQEEGRHHAAVRSLLQPHSSSLMDSTSNDCGGRLITTTQVDLETLLISRSVEREQKTNIKNTKMVKIETSNNIQ